MIRNFRSRLSYANVVATLALVVAVGGGTAWAAGKIRTRNIGYHAVTASKINYNAITAAKVKNNSLGSKELRDGSILTNDVRNGSLRAEDFAAGQLPKGDKGDKGDPGASIFGTVSATGVPGNNRGMTGVTGNSAVGLYTVSFAQDVSKCAVVATVATVGDTDGGTITAAPNGSPQQITFRTFPLGGGLPAPRAFNFTVNC
jgi:hypothetical protein